MVQVKIPAWLSNMEKLPRMLEGEVLAESPKAILLKGTALIGPKPDCAICGRNLTNVVSRVVGVGPICCEKLGIPRPDYENAKELEIQLRKLTAFEKWLPKARIEITGTYTVPALKKAPPKRHLWVENNHMYLQVAYEDREKAKAIPGRTWNPEKKAWQFTVSHVTVVQAKTMFPDLIVESEIEIPGTIDDKAEEGSVHEVDFAAVERNIFEEFKAPALPLYNYQKEGVDFLAGVKRALLADDMGLGKTIQIIATLERAGSRHNLIVCPNSLKWVWKNELEKWAPGASVVVVKGTPLTRMQQLRSERNYTIMNYEVLRQHAEIVTNENSKKKTVVLSPELDQDWSSVVFDEATYVKNRRSQQTTICQKLATKAERVYHVTGTPITNRSSELWPLLNMLYPEAYRSYWKFAEAYCKVYYNGYGWKVEDILDPKHPKVQALRLALKPLMIRRTKAEVLKDLPEKTVQKIWVDLEGTQRKIYDQMENDMIAELTSGEEIAATIVIAQITRLKQFTIDPELVADKTTPLEGAKIDALMDIIECLGGQKFVVFSQFARAIDGVSRNLEEAGIKYTTITGKVTGEDRDAAVKAFQEDPSVQGILITTQAGGMGLTLTAASTAIFMDKCWTPALNVQAQDRLHRIGQKNAVTVYELLARNTVEEQIEALLATKQQVFDQIIEKQEGESTGSFLLHNILNRKERQRKGGKDGHK